MMTRQLRAEMFALTVALGRLNCTRHYVRVEVKCASAHARQDETGGRRKRLASSPDRATSVAVQDVRIHREIFGSNFPRCDWNLNTGDRNYGEVHGIVAENEIHHFRRARSVATVPISPSLNLKR